VDDLTACGLVGEAVNKLTAYVASVSRKTDKPLCVVIQSNSAAGKTSLQVSILAMVPSEDLARWNAPFNLIQSEVPWSGASGSKKGGHPMARKRFSAEQIVSNSAKRTCC